MPIMDGYQATLEIRNYLKEIKLRQPIITAVTGHTEDSYVKKCFEYGMNQILSKPVNH
jgi:CheY-like chemotaxis protein